MKTKTKKEKAVKIATMGLTAIVMISGNGTNVDETDCPAAKIKEFSQSNQIVQISKPEKLLTLKQLWSKMSQGVKNKKGFKIVVDDISFDDINNISYKGVKSQKIDFSTPKVKSNISYDDSNITIARNTKHNTEKQNLNSSVNKKMRHT